MEGTIALALETSNAIERHRFHIEIEEDARKQRILSEYRLRGFGEAQALEVYLARRKDEFPVIEDLACAAHRVSLSSAGEFLITISVIS